MCSDLCYSQWTWVFVTLDCTLYISYKTIFPKNYCEVISKLILIIFAPEEAEIFKDYLFILTWLSVRLPLFSYDLKTFFCFLTLNLLYILTKIKSEKSTFEVKLPESRNHATNITIRKKQIKFKEFCVSWNKFHKNLPRDSFKICFRKHVVLYEIYSKNRKWRILISMDCRYRHI
jgi:hypothetical protein